MTNIELLKLLKEKKVADAFQYYAACSYKLYLAQVSCEALDKVINDFETNRIFTKKNSYDKIAISKI